MQLKKVLPSSWKFKDISEEFKSHSKVLLRIAIEHFGTSSWKGYLSLLVRLIKIAVLLLLPNLKREGSISLFDRHLRATATTFSHMSLTYVFGGWFNVFGFLLYMGLRVVAGRTWFQSGRGVFHFLIWKVITRRSTNLSHALILGWVVVTLEQKVYLEWCF